MVYLINLFIERISMPQHPLTDEQMLETLNAIAKCRTIKDAADMLGMNVNTLRHRNLLAKQRFGSEYIPAENPKIDQLAEAHARIKHLESLNFSHHEEKLTADYIKKKIIQLRDAPVTPPKWLSVPTKKPSFAGVPTLFASDWHWGEIVDPSQINGTNSFNTEIAQKRAKRMVMKATDLLKNHVAHSDYPGIVYVLGGDMVSGDIHEELMATNDMEIMPTVLDLFGVLIWCIETLANEFGNVFVPCVSGNHGRNTLKIRNKGRNFTSFDWLLYQFLDKHFEKDKRIQFLIPDGPDAYYSIFNHRYLLTHGDQFRGGDGVIGALGPIIRGDHRKRSRNAQIDMSYDTMIIGHWHQLIQLERLIVNGSLKGYDEYAYSNNFGFEPPRQAMWITHPEHGITFSIPIYVDDVKKVQVKEWISWK
jgi:hypothetical protein